MDPLSRELLSVFIGRLRNLEPCGRRAGADDSGPGRRGLLNPRDQPFHRVRGLGFSVSGALGALGFRVLGALGALRFRV